MRKVFKVLLWFVVLAIVVPILVGAGIGYARGWPDNWRSANWGSSGLLPAASQSPEARVLVLATRTGRWKGIFAEHMSLILKTEGAGHWTRYDVVGWGAPVRRDAYVADAYWYGNPPRILFAVEGKEASDLIPRIKASIARYPYRSTGSYTVWPGPNSNSFVAWVVRNTDGFRGELSAVAVGKDYLGPGFSASRTPSGTGWQAGYAGLIGISIGFREGLELHLLGSTIGLDPEELAIKLPALGKIGLLGS